MNALCPCRIYGETRLKCMLRIKDWSEHKNSSLAALNIDHRAQFILESGVTVSVETDTIHFAGEWIETVCVFEREEAENLQPENPLSVDTSNLACSMHACMHAMLYVWYDVAPVSDWPQAFFHSCDFGRFGKVYICCYLGQRTSSSQNMWKYDALTFLSKRKKKK